MARNSNLWKKNSYFSNDLSVLCTAIKILIIVATCDIVTAKVLPSAKTSICNKEQCVYSASGILKNMDKTVDPCDDFYGFACGGFMQSTTLLDNQKSSRSSTESLYNVLHPQIKKSLEKPSQPNEIEPFRLVKNFYKSCMNLEKIETHGLNPLKSVLEKLGGWPVLNKTLRYDAIPNWKDYIYKLAKLGYSTNSLISMNIQIDEKNSKRRRIVLDQAELILPKDYLIKGLKDKITRAYFDFMVKMAVALGTEKSFAEAELKKVVEFEMSLANISISTENIQNEEKLYNLGSIQRIQRYYKTIPWNQYINKVLAPDYHVNSTEQVIVRVPGFFKKFEKLMKNTSKKVVANYIIWRVVFESAPYLNQQVQSYIMDLSTIFTGIQQAPARWSDCVLRVSRSLDEIVGALYVREHFHQETKNLTLELVNNIRKRFKTMLIEEVSWMDKETKNSALQKLDSITNYVAYPEKFLDDKKLEDTFKNLKIDQDDYLGKQLSLNLFTRNRTYAQLRQPVKKTDWSEYGLTTDVNAYYSGNENAIVLPAAVLRYIYFDKDRPRYVNYAAIGSVIGHEITHGFDLQGSQYDKNGNLVNWWNLETKKKYLAKAQCIIEQYGNYTVKEINMKVDGKKTQNENIADNGGIKQAYHAYLEWAKDNPPEPILPGLIEYNQKQLFWITSANLWCAKYRPEMLQFMIQNDGHSPGKFRVIGPLSNRPEFSADFNCKPGSKMNPEKKCSVW